MISLKLIFRLLCVLLSSGLIIWQTYRYLYSDEDIIQVNFKRFHSEQHLVYPDLTLCFGATDPSRGNQTDVKHNTPRKGLRNIGIDNDTLQIEDYIDRITIKDSHGHVVQYSRSGMCTPAGTEGRTLSTNVVLRRYQIGNCFAIGIPFVEETEMHEIDVRIKNEVFKSNNAPSKQHIDKKKTLSIGLTHQNQFFPLVNGKQISYDLDPDFDSGKCLGFIINVRGMEIVHLRNKVNFPCNNFGTADSIKFLSDLTNRLGCKPQHWKFPSELPDCSPKVLRNSRDKLDQGMYDSHLKRLATPCQYIHNFWHDYTIDTSCDDGHDEVYIKVIYNDVPFKEIKFVPAHTLWRLAMNVLTISGVILGLSVIQIPELLSKAKKHAKNCLINEVRKDKNKIIQEEPKIDNSKETSKAMLVVKHQPITEPLLAPYVDKFVYI